MSEQRSDPIYRSSVRQIQSYLYTISEVDGDISRVNPDGIYGNETEAAVRGFQKKHSLAQSGKVDFATWKKLLSEYLSARVLLSPPLAISPFSVFLKNGELIIGDRSDTVLAVSQMLRTMSVDYACFEDLPISDVFTAELRAAIQEFQAILGIEEHGKIDLTTWNALSRVYNKYASSNM